MGHGHGHESLWVLVLTKVNKKSWSLTLPHPITSQCWMEKSKHQPSNQINKRDHHREEE